MSTARLSMPSWQNATPVALGALLIVALVFGGAMSGGAVPRSGVEILAALLIAVWLWAPNGAHQSVREGRPLLFCAAAFGALAAAQLIPLPAAIWSALPGRAEIADGFKALGVALPALPLSMDPEATRDSLFAILAPVAAFLLAAHLNLRTTGMAFAWMICVLAVASFLFGVVQIQGGVSSPLYVYEVQNRGMPTGMFANVNHQATLLLMATPFIAALIGNLRARASVIQAQLGKLALTAALAVLILAGLVLCVSVAGYVMIGPLILIGVLIATGHVVRSGRSAWFWLGVAGLPLAGGAIATLPLVAQWSADLNWGDGATGRPELFARTAEGAAALFPFGAGLGAFRSVYPQFENPDLVTPTYAPHAHNDYLQIAFELGLPGLAICAAALLWWLNQTLKIWRLPRSATSRLRRAASVAVGVTILHSVVDYPLRTLTIATLAGLCAGIMTAPSEEEAADTYAASGRKPPRTVDI